ncbi:histidine ammonia-lyase [Roseisolibacter agri]|uniref:Histidine ammonia-lyase n=1 Tax=Roseisolibacter agri TaxID=2014610 RepID=A0AA37QKL6_9BACT|nr:histidine ammonia-lyase [Roseisolibacter agri]GLC27533.1 histidine ammonia-lyase [Roseisolibacter agri]
MNGTEVVIDGRALTLASLRAVADGSARAVLSPEARARMLATRAVVDDIVARDAVVYGVTTGFGKLSEVAIPPDRLRALQVNLVRSHAAGVGTPLSTPEVRAMMLLRANVLACGHSGARPELVELLLAMLAQGVHPVVPEQGSVGASGDLAPLSHLALVLIGEGEAEHGGRVMAGCEALAAAGLSPATLEPKEGLALVNGTQAHAAVGALALAEAVALWQTAHAAGAMTVEALMGTPDAFDARIHDVRGQHGQRESAALLRALLADSEIRESHRTNDPRVQDAYALRCMPQVHGPVLDALRFAGGLLGRELNAATDNPLVFADGTMLSGGNFHGQAGAMAADVLAIALTNLATMSERRIDRLVHPDLNHGMPAFLANEPGLESGFMMAQVSAAALASECKTLAHPASVDTIPTDGSKEDVVPMAMGAALKLRRVVHNVRHVLAIELLCGARGIDLRAPLRPSAGVAATHAAVRALVAPLTGDRPPSPDVRRLADAIAEGRFVPQASRFADSILAEVQT